MFSVGRVAGAGAALFGWNGSGYSPTFDRYESRDIIHLEPADPVRNTVKRC